MTTIAERLRRARIMAGLSQDALAIALRITRPAVTLWETGQTAPSRGRLKKVADILGVSVSWLLNGGDDGPEDLDEVALLRAYRRVGADDKRHIQRVVRALDATADVAQRLERAQTKK